MKVIETTGPKCDIHKVDLVQVTHDNRHFLKCPVKGCKFTRYKG